MKHVISFRRPELRHVLATMTVPPEGDVPAQIRHLESLGYTIVAVSPPLEVYGPPQPSRKPELIAVSEPSTSVRGDAE